MSDSGSEAPVSRRPPFHKRVLLVNPKLQIGYSIAVAWLVIVSVILTTVTVYYTVTEIAYIPATKLLDSKLKDTGGATIEEMKFTDAVEVVHRTLLFRVAATLVVLVATGVFLTVFFMHRICGPIYRFERILRAASEGDIPIELQLRKNDEFKNLAHALVQTLHATKRAGIEVGKKTAAIEAVEGKLFDDSDATEPAEEENADSEGDEKSEPNDEESDVVESAKG